ncbi:MAG: anhydro-N-acetylmuramic acid kinase [Gammaproteobacteria bacterium]|nr:anhydro-N-acetylmuramic acid kinase [Gammaproteobacteria bacterium]
MTQRQLYIGLMSGTSLDGIDAVIADCRKQKCIILHQHHQAFPSELEAKLRELILAAQEPDLHTRLRLGEELACCYAKCVAQLLQQSLTTSDPVTKHEVIAIGNHGQTVFHQPPLSVQLDNGQMLADHTGIVVVNQFRQADLLTGGEGAPLVPAFHQKVFSSENENRVVVNIGGIANITVLEKSGAVGGFDTGPGNTLMDEWALQSLGKPYDENGDWGRSGTINNALLKQMLSAPWFDTPPPKSTGRELFNRNWLSSCIEQIDEDISPADIQATLCELTATSIVAGIKSCLVVTDTLIVCGGGIHNQLLLERLKRHLPEAKLCSTSEWEIDPDFTEAAAFAWLAMAKTNNIAGNIPQVTGASKPCILGVTQQPRNTPG